ncbi:group II intron reverse transcriptase/maturase [Orenia metallireducens]|uniref:Group II intron reverse transcriptase/maturase n=1 Tax=Orenia metallireducens TaxID=1413210 RepID=A0A285IMF7_9FIRM|nr:group II intron reverse transcriptase/maturase [Orenia metallireducens]PRX16403.1 group II intron reverse transcriptase/maturase [Orenia metallireducens]SNY48151.1 group II intron reverse transcriptase/maturase [Orenia metallireducens]
MRRIRTYYTLKNIILDKFRMHYAAQQVLSNGGCAGIDGEDIEDFKDNYKLNMREIYRQMKEKRYKPSPVLRTYIPKGNGKERPLGIPTVKDRIAQATVKQVMEIIFERVFCDCSYGFRPNRSAHDAIDKIEEYKSQGYKWVVDADIKSYFDNIDHELLMDFVAEYISDGWVLGLIRSWLTAGIMNKGKKESTEKGTPQGGVISPLLANIYLHQFDKEMTARGYKLVRYADDFVVLTKSKLKANRALEVIKEIIEGKLKLTLHPEKTVITNFGKGFVFLGYEFIAWRYKRPRKKAIDKFKDKIRNITRRQRPFPAEFIIAELNPVLRGWANYFKFGNVKKLFRKLDTWIRMRIRAFMEKKKAILNQNYRISNSMLEEKGLISLLTYCFN